MSSEFSFPTGQTSSGGGGPPTGPAGGGLTGTYPNPGLDPGSVKAAAGPLAGDATGPLTATVVQRVQGQPWDATPPSAANQVPTWDGAKWTPRTPPSFTPAWSVFQDNNGNDANDGLTPRTPVRTGVRALAVLTALGTTAQNIATLHLGSAQLPVSPLLDFSAIQGLQIVGKGPNASRIANGFKYHPTTATAFILDIRDVYINDADIKIDAAGTSPAVTITGCQIPQATLVSPNNGADQITVWDSWLESSLTTQGSVAFESCFAGTLTVSDASGVTWKGGEIFVSANLLGAGSKLTTLGVNTFDSSGGSYAVTGVAGSTLSTDLSSIHGATLTGVTVINLDQNSPRYVYDPTVAASSGNTFKTWPEVVTAVAAGQAAPEALIMQSGPVSSIAMRGGKFTSPTPQTGFIVADLSDGQVIDGIASVSTGLLLTVAPTAAPAITPIGLTGVPIFQVGGGASFMNLSPNGTPALTPGGFEVVTVFGSSVLAGPGSWQPSNGYSIGDLAQNGGSQLPTGIYVGGNVYQCTAAGTSAGAGGPSGTGGAIVDGTVTWRYIANTWLDTTGGTVIAVAGDGPFSNFPTNWAIGSGTILYFAFGMCFIPPLLPNFTGTVNIVYGARPENFGPQVDGSFLGAPMGGGLPTFRAIGPGSLAGLTPQQVLFGSGGGGIAQSASLAFDGASLLLAPLIKVLWGDGPDLRSDGTGNLTIAAPNNTNIFGDNGLGLISSAGDMNLLTPAGGVNIQAQNTVGLSGNDIVLSNGLGNLTAPTVATRYGAGILQIDPTGIISVAGPIVPVAPPMLPPDDWDFSVPFATTDARWGITAHMAGGVTTGVRRGDVWVLANALRERVLNGRLLLQVSADATLYEVATYLLTGGLQPNDAVALAFSVDSSDTVVAADELLFLWGQSTGGDVDTNNTLILQVAQAALDAWVIVLGINEAGVGTSLYAQSFPSFNSPALAIGMENHGGSFRSWAGDSLQSMHRLGADYASAITPDRVAVYLMCDGTPNRTFGLTAFRRQADMTF